MKIMQVLGDSFTWTSNSTEISLAILLFLGIGLIILISPILAWIIPCILGIIFVLALFGVHAYVCVGAAVLVATLSRLAVASGFFPSMINFLHFPLVIGAVFVAISQRSKGVSPVVSPVAKGLYGLFFLSLFSWIANGGEIARPFFTWLVFCEPFLLIYALLKMPPGTKAIRWLWGLVFGIAFLQLPLGLWQAFTLGLPDPVQGTLIGMGAGAHVAAGITTIGVFLCVSKGLAEKSPLRMCSWLVCALMLFAFSILSGAKQVLIAFLPSLLFMIVTSRHIRINRLIPIVMLLGLAVCATFYFYSPLRMAIEWNLISQAIWGKIEAIAIIGAKMSKCSYCWIIGLGPGNSVSRVALLSVGGIVSESSPIYLLGLQLAPTTLDILSAWKASWLYSSSSVWSGISSWFGLFGDIGFAGLGLYLWMVWELWRGLGHGREWDIRAVKALFIMAGMLGAMFSWLEEPSFTLLMALTVGLALVSNRVIAEQTIEQEDRLSGHTSDP